ncbi:sulfatase-like hydrolase/transferase [Mariniblastus fucicola]|uniref:sulfatase-like hydrolase/transferase n=1 Tax=Mariniblastus fucicola TaxID=980251 RepID=UPI0009463969|nr:sulfatase-like hydrolase/transferase [Mariniblastus fucicola]
METTAKSYWIVCLFLLLCTASNVSQQRPNIIVIMADDLGYADVGCYGCTDIPTPNIDQLASDGVRFTSAYVTGNMYDPSRAENGDHCKILAGQDSKGARRHCPNPFSLRCHGERNGSGNRQAVVQSRRDWL